MNLRTLVFWCAALALPAGGASAAPILYFNGTASYSATNALLTVDAVLTLAEGAGAVAVPGTVSFAARWLATQAPAPGVTVGEFTGPATAGDLLVQDAGAGTLLTGELLGMTATGFDGFDFAVLEGLFSATGGALASLFTGGGDLLALEFNLSQIISPALYDHDFTALVDGRLSAVAMALPAGLAPVALALLAAALAGGPSLARRRRAGHDLR